MYRVWCQVSGGRTGFRGAWLKVDGEVFHTDDHSEAQEKADLLNGKMNGPHATASFRYTVESL